MKALLILFCLSALEYLVCGYDVLLQPRIQERVYPKKFHPFLHKNIKLMNRMYSKKSPVDEEGLPVNTKKPGVYGYYTAFPYNTQQAQAFMSFMNGNIPESPYFPAAYFEYNREPPKPRVKKVLGEQFFSRNRKKRSAEKEVVAENPSTMEKTHKKPSTDEDILTKKQTDVTNSQLTENLPEKHTEEKENVTKTELTAAKATDNVSTHKNVTENKNTAGKAKDTVSTKREKKVTKKEETKNKVAKPSKSGNSTKLKTRKSKHAKHSKKKNKRSKKEHASHKKGKKVKRSLFPKETRRLIAGRDALIEDYPYVVSIQKNGEHWCSGALLNPRLVITTANCVWKANRMSRLTIRAGSRYVSQGGQTARVAEVMKHPRWSIRSNPDCDIALLLLDKNLRFSHSVHAVDIPNRIMTPPFEDAWVTSWGSERRDGVFEKKEMTLQVFHARVLDRAKCSNITMRYGIAVNENFICLTQDGRRAPCTRDTGAPAVSDGVVWGLASWGIRKLCGTERFPAMFSYVASTKNMDFIINATTSLMSEFRQSPFLGRYPRRRRAYSRKRHQVKKRRTRGSH